MDVMGAYRNVVDSIYAVKFYDRAMAVIASPLVDDVEPVAQGQNH